jgi:rhodanese-related sulfurtransferase
MKYLFLILFFLGSSIYSTAQNQVTLKPAIAKDLTVKEFTKQMQNNPGVLLDVRTPGEVKKGAIEGSINIDFFDDDFEARVNRLDKTKPIYIYCAVGGRSGEAIDLMKQKGFVELYNLAGGYSAWMKAGK